MFTHWSGILSHWQAFCVYVAFIPMEAVICKWLRLSFWLCQLLWKMQPSPGCWQKPCGAWWFKERFLRLDNQICSQNKNLKRKNSSDKILFHPHLWTESAARAFEIYSCHHTKRCQRLVSNLVYTGWVHICSVWFLM